MWELYRLMYNVQWIFLCTRCRPNIETVLESLALCYGNPPVNGGPPHRGPGLRSFDIFLVLNRITGDLRPHVYYHSLIVLYVSSQSVVCFHSYLPYHYKDAVLRVQEFPLLALRPSYLYNGNLFTWKEGLYMETCPSMQHRVILRCASSYFISP